ncbi:uncharacterized protein BO88DRAFT_427255 [Aspergillus vadensis CBS 113365]|uniref:Uncharacterized protein n=1 Tax=Aspergillus vadensis (strain CBS 113365 / IMI 142717 / IBT 24658) TaxID=1448311 RepID=A0A319BMZ0_ASPVC|nr:hypothetical protein BO88DRAFT_427255 [Aspergillus vadensis CBS 113365]PYH67073.1 hypothetical protein BO88DRAFT_427255 [Aspergillus vadensis CBS 113365]
MLCSGLSDSYIFFNITPFSSTFICGSQNSGKSHILSCILENCLILSKAGQLLNPLTEIIFYYDTFISNIIGSFYEAAFLFLYSDIKRVYLKLNIIDNGPIPLYMHTVKCILREMRMEQQAAHTGFDYCIFKNKVLNSNLTPILESFMPQLQTLPISGKNKAASEGIN